MSDDRLSNERYYGLLQEVQTKMEIGNYLRYRVMRELEIKLLPFVIRGDDYFIPHANIEPAWDSLDSDSITRDRHPYHYYYNLSRDVGKQRFEWALENLNQTIDAIEKNLPARAKMIDAFSKAWKESPAHGKRGVAIYFGLHWTRVNLYAKAVVRSGIRICDRIDVGTNKVYYFFSYEKEDLPRFQRTISLIGWRLEEWEKSNGTQKYWQTRQKQLENAELWEKKIFGVA